MVRKYFLAIIVFTVCILMIWCNSKNTSQVSYQGETLNWESIMKFDEDDKFVVNIKYIGDEELPLDVNFNIEYLSGNTSGGALNYGELSGKIGGFTLEEDYDKAVYGEVSQHKNKEKLKIIMIWNNKKEVIELNKVL